MSKVLIVDDDAFCTEMIGMFLEDLDCEFESAANGKLGVDAFKSHFKNLKFVLMDFHMPEMDGFEASKLIKAF